MATKRGDTKARRRAAKARRTTASRTTSADARGEDSPRNATRRQAKPAARRAAKKPADEKSTKPANEKRGAKKPSDRRPAKPAVKKPRAKKAATPADEKTAKSTAKKPAARRARSRPARGTAKSAAKRPVARRKATASLSAGDGPPAPESTVVGSDARAAGRADGLESAPSNPARTGREDAEGTVVITGIAGRLGRQLCRVLHRTRPVVGIDRRPFLDRPKDVVHHPVDLRRKKTRDVLRLARPQAVVHLGVLHDPRASDRERHKWNVVAFQKLLEYVAEYEIPKLVVLSSANVYGPQPDNPQFLSEEAPLLGAQAFRAMRDLVEMDMLAQSFFWKRPATETVVLRPVHILGGVRNAPSNYLRLERPITILGFDPMVQVIHERDVVGAIVKALTPGVRGIFNLRGPGELPLSRVLRMLGRRPRVLPAFAARAALERLWKFRLTSFPAPEIDYIRYLCMVDDSRARKILGFQPRYGLEETIRAVLSER